MRLYLYSVFNSGKVTSGTLPLMIEEFIHKGVTLKKKVHQNETVFGTFYIKRDDIEEFKSKYTINSLIPMTLTDLRVESFPDRYSSNIKIDNRSMFWAIPEKSFEQWNTFTLQDVLNRPKNNKEFKTFIYLSINSFKKLFNLNKIDLVVDKENNWYTLCDNLYFFKCKKDPDLKNGLSYMVPDGDFKRAILVNTTFGRNPFKTIFKL